MTRCPCGSYPHTTCGGYDPIYFKVISEIEQRHFWFAAREKLIRWAVAQSIATLKPGYRVLEVGCGNGNILRTLAETCVRSQVIGLDLYSECLSFAGEHSGCPVVSADVSGLPFVTGFQVIGAFDVLEHVADDIGALTSMFETLVEGGTLLVTVPADPSLWSYFDEDAHHCRRYEARELQTKLEQAGFTMKMLTHFMSVTYPLIWLRRRVAVALSSVAKQRQRSETELKIIPVINSTLKAALVLERLLICRGVRLPIGSSLLAVAQKPFTSRVRSISSDLF